DDYRRNHPRFNRENFGRNLELVTRVREIAAEKDCTPSQLALAWLLAQGIDIVPIPGTKRRKYLEENAGGAAVPLSRDELRRVEQVLPRGSVSGTRYAAHMMALLDRGE
ncbi:MAG: aldo/keto reductase, partial [Gemmatimonadales bacterium]